MQNYVYKKSIIYLIDALIAFFCVAGFYQIATKAGTGVHLGTKNDQILVTEIKDTGLNNPLKIGDIILEIEGQTLASVEEIEFILDKYPIGQSLSFLIQRQELKISMLVRLAAYNNLSYLIVLLLVAPVFFILGIVVLIKRPAGDPVALIFHWMSVFISVYICTTFGRFTAIPFIPPYLIRFVFILAVGLTPVLFLHLSFLFPRIKWPKYYPLIRLLYGAVLLFIIYLGYLLFNALKPASLPFFQKFMSAYNAARFALALITISGILNFIHSYRQAVEESERRKLRWVMLGLAIAPLSFIFLWQLPQILTSVALVRGEVILLSSAVIPITFAISIVRYHILDIDLIFNRSTVYILVFTVLIAVYTAIVALAAVLVGAFTTQASIIASAIAAVAVALLFEPARRATQRFVDRKFFRVRYNYRIAQRTLSSEIDHINDRSGLIKVVINKLDELLQPEGMAFFMHAVGASKKNIVGVGSLKTVPSTLKNFLTSVSEYALPPVMAQGKYLEDGISFEALDPNLFGNNPVALVLPLRLYASGDGGFLVLGRKKSHTRYAYEDMDLLKTVVAQTLAVMERIRLQEELTIQHAETKRLAELNRMKSFFVSSVSHDLQTPLTSIKMFAELLQDKPNISKKDKQEYLEIIQGESERLSRLINNVLNFSRIERGVKEYQMDRINLVTIVKNAARCMDYQINQNGFEFELQAPQQEIMVRADADAITEALTNLLDNAIKYAGTRKKITLAVSQKPGFAEVQISDQGIGIAAAEQEKIFDAFYRSTDKKIQPLGGAGLGLTQVRHIAEAHKGHIALKSKPGSGSTFSLILPMESSQ